MDLSRSPTCDNTSVTLLAEIVGGYKIGESNEANITFNSGSAYIFCVVRHGERLIHKTKTGEGGRNPVWTALSHSTFLITATPEALAHDSLDVSVWGERRDPFNLTVLETIFLGNVNVDLADVVTSYCDEQHLDMQLTRNDGPKASGTLTMRFRFATSSDEKFLGLLSTRPELLKQLTNRRMETDENDKTGTTSHLYNIKSTSLLVTELDETEQAGQTFMNAVTGVFVTRRYFDSASGQDKILVKPGPDPNRKETTTYLTRQEILAETSKPSHQWVEAGSGKLGKLYLEILSCHNLPNVDVGEAVGNLTDAFICAVFEDVMVQTNVIDDELSPHWLPWTQRAFVFGMMHPASMLYLGAFDFDLGVTDHDALGRAVVNISNFQQNTDYILEYKLYPSTNVTERTSAGSIKIRLRIEFDNEKEILLAALRPRFRCHINCSKEKTLSVLRYTCFGEYGDDNEQAFDLTVTRSYVNEILGYKRAIFYCLGDALRSLVFWRGQVKIGEDLAIPLHSFLFFCFATTLVEKPYLAPPFLLLAIAWVMLATQTLRLQHPSPWNRCHSFSQHVEVLLTGASSPAYNRIKVGDGAQEAEEYEKKWQNRLEKDQAFAATQAALQEKITKLGDDSIHTKLTGGIPLDLIDRLTRYQGIMARFCMKLRLVKIILTWEESYVTFWITACFLAGGLVSLLLPWSRICLWSSRILVWSIFGPHMKLLDLYFQNSGHDDVNLENVMNKFKEQSRFAISRRQEAVKMRDMKLLWFGRFSSLVPSHNLSRHHDRPLSSSSAQYCHPKNMNIKLAPEKIRGQHLFGKMIPKSESEIEECEDQLLKLRNIKHSVVSAVQAIKEAERVQSLCSKEKPLDETGYELISVFEDGLSNKKIYITDTASLSVYAESKVSILREDCKRSSSRRNSSKDNESIEGISSDMNAHDEVQIGCSLTNRVETKVTIAKANNFALSSESQENNRTSIMTSIMLPGPNRSPRRKADDAREAGEVEIVLADCSFRDDPSDAEETLERTYGDDDTLLYYDQCIEQKKTV